MWSSKQLHEIGTFVLSPLYRWIHCGLERLSYSTDTDFGVRWNCMWDVTLSTNHFLEKSLYSSAAQWAHLIYGLPPHYGVVGMDWCKVTIVRNVQFSPLFSHGPLLHPLPLNSHSMLVSLVTCVTKCIQSWGIISYEAGVLSSLSLGPSPHPPQKRAHGRH